MSTQRRVALSCLVAALTTCRAAWGLVVLDPICVQECHDANCGSAPQDQFATCTSACTTNFTTCPELGQCWVKCDQARTAFRLQCQSDDRQCIRRRCRVLVGSFQANPAVPSLRCQRSCRLAAAQCRVGQGTIHTLHRLCAANCTKKCAKYSRFGGAIQACMGVCDDRFSTDTSCQDTLDGCLGNCEVSP